MSPAAKKLLLTSIRVAVCVVALGWVLYGVSLRDYAELDDGRRVTLVDEDEATVTVVVGGAEQVLPHERVAANNDGTPRIEYGLYTAVRRSRLDILPLCLLVFAPVPFLQSLRFVWMLRAQD
ncbi:MAG: hypothetical protein GY778_10760, partial [bacterium]|nr:hypothetical protein [bacterium]